MVHGVEILLNIQINDPLISRVQVFQRLRYGPVTVSARSESIAVLTEISLVAQRQYLRCCLLYHSVYDGGDAQRPLFPVGLWDVDPSHRLRLVLLCPDLCLDLVSMLCKVPVKFFHRHLVDPGCAFVSLDGLDRRFEVLVLEYPLNQFHDLLLLLLLVKPPKISPPAFCLHGRTFPLAGHILGFGMFRACLQRFALL